MRWFFIWIMFLPLGAFAQPNLVKVDAKIGCSCKDLDYNSLHIAEKAVTSGEVQDTLAACYFHCIGIRYYVNGEYAEAIKNHKNAARLREKVQPDFVWKSHYAMGMAYNQLSMYHKSKSSLEQAEKIKGKKRNKDKIEMFRVMAENLAALGELNQAKNYGIRATKIEEENKRIANAYTTLSAVLAREEQSTENKKLAIEYADTAISLDPTNNSIVPKALNNKANALSWLGRYDEAINTYKLALNQHINDPENYAETLSNIGSDLGKKGKPQAAIKTLTESLEIKKEIYENAPHQYTYAANYENLGEIYVQTGDYEKALRHFQLAINNLKDDPKSETPYIYNKPDLIRVLDLKAQAAFKAKNIDLAYETYINLDNWINEFYKDLSSNESKLTWIARAHDTYGHAIEVALAKNDKEKAFEYAEKAHAVLLWQSLSQQAARSLLLEEERKKMDDLSLKIRQADQQYRNGEIQIEVLRNLENQRDELEKTFENYEIYHNRKYQAEATTVSDIKKKIIDNNTAFIEYYRTDEVLYIFIITKNNIGIIQQNVDGLTDDISTFVKNISRKNMDVDNYHTLAHKLYTQLIPSPIRSNDDIKHLVIVPDREIGTLPFAALATQVTSGKLNKNTPFLLKKYTTNYLYSAGSYLQLQQKPANQKYCFAGIAPVEYQMEKWKNEPLPHSEKELDGIKSLHWQWQREILMREQATKAEFERIIREGYRTIQVSTHAVFDDNKGQIIFHDKVITQGEIDQLEINTHRLILSACETGVGIQNQGEGILSLGWNFAYKGVPSITMTHWSVSDNSTKDIMIHYHENLNNSTPADQALQTAQQSYLNAEKVSDEQFSPYYWAAFFHTGNTE